MHRPNRTQITRFNLVRLAEIRRLTGLDWTSSRNMPQAFYHSCYSMISINRIKCWQAKKKCSRSNEAIHLLSIRVGGRVILRFTKENSKTVFFTHTSTGFCGSDHLKLAERWQMLENSNEPFYRSFQVAGWHLRFTKAFPISHWKWWIPNKM